MERVPVGMVHGRFQPFHLGHLAYLRCAAARSQRLLVGITSPDRQHLGVEPDDPSRSQPTANPLSYTERLLVIEAVLGDEGVEDAHVIPFPVGLPELWPDYVPAGTVHFLRVFDAWGETKVARLRSAGYAVEVLDAGATKEVTGTEVRERLLAGGDWESLVPPATARVLRELGVAGVRPVVLVMLDGLGDRASAELGGRTANEAATTPNLDALCARGSNGLLWPLGPGRAPSSELAHWAMLGCLPEEFPGRAVLEARGNGVPVEPGHAYAYAALRPAERVDGRLHVVGRPRPEDEDDARTLVAAVAEAVPVIGRPPLAFTLSYLGKGEAILAVRGGDERVTDTDPFFRDRDPVLRPLPLVPDATLGARTVEAWTRAAIEALAAHPVNEARVARGRAPLAVVTTKWWGRPRPGPSFAGRTGLGGAILGASPFLAGLAQTVGLSSVRLGETDDPGVDLSARLDRVAELLAAGATFVLTHQKATDEAGHNEDPRRKLETIERIDAAIARLAGPPFDGCVVCVTGDHVTPTSPEVIHAGDPVPFALAGPGVRADRVSAFGELDQRDGILGHLRGEDVLPVLLNAADRPLFLGSRPTAVPHALGHPAGPEALELSSAPAGPSFGLVASGQRPGGMPDDPGVFRAVAELAEGLGLDSLWATDHLVVANPILEGLVALSHFAGCTRRIRLGAGVYLLALRHPVVVAKQVATLDWLSGGRLSFGVGLGGDSEAEFDAVEVSSRERGARVDEGIACLRALWAGGPASHAGRFHAFRDVDLRPRPAQPGGPPILVGGRVEAALRRAGTLGDGWLASMCSPEGFARDWARVLAHAERAGRDPAALEPLAMLPTHVGEDDARAREELRGHLEARYGRAFPADAVESACLAGSAATVAERVRAYLDAGVRHVVFSLASTGPAEVELLARDVVAPLRAVRPGPIGPGRTAAAAPV